MSEFVTITSIWWFVSHLCALGGGFIVGRIYQHNRQSLPQ